MGMMQSPESPTAASRLAFEMVCCTQTSIFGSLPKTLHSFCDFDFASYIINQPLSTGIAALQPWKHASEGRSYWLS